MLSWRVVLGWNVDQRQKVDYIPEIEKGWGSTKEQKMKSGSVHRFGEYYYQFINSIRSNSLVLGKIYGAPYYGANSGFMIIRYRGISYTKGATQAEFSSMAEVFQRFKLKDLKQLYLFELYKNWLQPGPWSRLHAGNKILVNNFFAEHSELVAESEPEFKMWVDFLRADGNWDENVGIFYLYNGRWVAGSGGESLTFWEVEEVSPSIEGQF